MQANLSYLAAIMNRNKYPQVPGPAVMNCAYKLDPEVNRLYSELPQYFGDWKGAGHNSTGSMSGPSRPQMSPRQEVAPQLT